VAGSFLEKQDLEIVGLVHTGVEVSLLQLLAWAYPQQHLYATLGFTEFDGFQGGKGE